MATININSWTDLAKIGNDVSYPMGGDYILTKDLSSSDADYIGIGDSWEPIADSSNTFIGIFDGDNHTISDIIIDKSISYTGLFAAQENPGIIKNLGLINGNITNVGYITGGIIGWNDGTIENCYNSCSVTGDSTVGGIVGYNGYDTSAKVEKCYNSGTITGDNLTGGIVGNNWVLIKDCYNSGSIIVEGNRAGGVSGNNDNWQYSIIENCYNIGNLSGNYNKIGGITGVNTSDATIKNSYSIGSISSSGTDIGGTIGDNSGTVTNCGWYTGAGGDATDAIGSTSGSVDHETADATDFYDREYDYISGSQNGMYRASDGSYYWTEGSPWYWHVSDYPDFIEVVAGYPHNIAGVSNANISKIGGVAKGDIAKVGGVE